jgi:DNA-binding CsgD family transcriptional regulator
VLAFAREHELGMYVQPGLGMRAALGLLRGDWTGAEADCSAALAYGDEAGLGPFPALVALGSLQARRGDAAARETLDAARERALAAGDLQRLVPVAAARLELGLLTGDAEPMVAEGREVYERAVGGHEPWRLGELASRLTLAGAPPDLPAGVPEPYRLALAGNWAEAAAIWDEIGRPYDAAEARSLADDDGALLQALGEFDRLGAAPAAARLRKKLRGRGVRAVPRGPRPATRALPRGLTPRQHEVLGLLAGGATNAEIAERLVVSPKTVDHHVSAVLAKLDVTSRREAAAVARELGISPGEGGDPAVPR